MLEKGAQRMTVSTEPLPQGPRLVDACTARPYGHNILFFPLFKGKVRTQSRKYLF